MKISSKEIIKLRAELNSKKKPLHTTKEIKLWYRKIIKQANIKIKTIPLKKCNSWKMNDNGHIAHSSGSFYKVEGIRVLKSFNREIKEGWDQPMFTEPGFDGGILGLLKKKINNMPHYLVNAKFEPGNYNFIQLSPTVQATFSNIKKAHRGRNVKFINFFKSPNKNNCKIIFKQWVSEEGGRLRNKRNLGIVLEHLGNDKLDIETDFKWITLRQIKQLILENAMINPHLRTLVSFI
jgi:oxidase EvaA|tara:strand:+ start:639 stop:1346 length:708 start_codon:yes stop_codon:yes gene_type:complete